MLDDALLDLLDRSFDRFCSTAIAALRLSAALGRAPVALPLSTSCSTVVRPRPRRSCVERHRAVERAVAMQAALRLRDVRELVGEQRLTGRACPSPCRASRP